MRVFLTVLGAWMALVGGAFADVDSKGFLIVRKSLVGDYAVQGKNATVSIEIYNAGDNPAFDVSLTDLEYPEEYFELIDGDLSASFDRVGAGAVVKHSYVVRARVSGPFILRPATVKYRPEEEADDEAEVLSTSGIMRIVQPSEARTLSLLNAGKYISLGRLHTLDDWRNFAIVAVVVTLLVGGYWAYSKANTSIEKRKRSNAVKELGLDDDKSD